MTLEQYQQNLSNLAVRITERAVDAAIVPAASALLARIKNRVVNDGKGSNGAKIGNYSTKPAYYTREQFVKKGAFKAVGKTGKKTKKSMYLQDGYKGLREKQGRRTDTINAEYSGDTNLAYQMGKEPKGVSLGFTRQKASLIRKGLEKRFGPIYSGTSQEITLYSTDVTNNIQKVTRQILAP